MELVSNAPPESFLTHLQYRYLMNHIVKVTIGAEANEIILIVIHTFRNMDADVSLVRIISARKATKEEARQYQERR